MGYCVFKVGDVVGHPGAMNFGTIEAIEVKNGEAAYTTAEGKKFNMSDRKGTGIWAKVEWNGTVTSEEPIDELYHYHRCSCPR